MTNLQVYYNLYKCNVTTSVNAMSPVFIVVKMSGVPTELNVNLT